MNVQSRTIALIFALLVCFAAMAQQPERKTDQKFIRFVVDKNGFYERSGPNGEYTSQRDRVVFDGCRMTFHVVAVGADAPSYKRETLNYDMVMDLKKMDPNAVARPTDFNGDKLPGGREWIMLKTADGQEWIEIMRGDNLASASSAWRVQGGANHVENQKLADALSRVITACRPAK